MNRDEVDEEVLLQLKKLNLKPEGASEEEMKKNIRMKKNLDYCVIYEFLSHEKFIKKCFQK
eukprot:CAMPEP_0202966164 /NCGR_PEP_ID=MMETSP1396-20130829/10453_1 /ASSEMBLY_ACC=CAM_ASM_000872 /TAXON_ID= /ORGANISM="Pseudokeronopsis sp., Strain Brazil" /LENGTH=60 /DNA_ID=CAMNT_0049689699 /DNA_START=660 /DNA_END=842 /DNA_ORIENTATION=+